MANGKRPLPFCSAADRLSGGSGSAALTSADPPRSRLTAGDAPGAAWRSRPLSRGPNHGDPGRRTGGDSAPVSRVRGRGAAVRCLLCPCLRSPPGRREGRLLPECYRVKRAETAEANIRFLYLLA